MTNELNGGTARNGQRATAIVMDQPGYSPTWQPPDGQPRAGTLLYEFVRKADGAFIHCELVDKRPSLGGVEIRIFIGAALSLTYRFDSSRLAELWAKQLLRRDLENVGRLNHESMVETDPQTEEPTSIL